MWINLEMENNNTSGYMCVCVCVYLSGTYLYMCILKDGIVVFMSSIPQNIECFPVTSLEHAIRMP